MTPVSQVDQIYKVTEDSIFGFFKDHRFLSNFHGCQVLVEGTPYPSTEHAYMAQKTLDQNLRLDIAGLSTPSAARKYGQSVPLRSDVNWDGYRFLAMYKVNLAKYLQNPHLAELLLATRDKYLEETNWWGDRYWGKCFGTGENNLGKVLMLVREVVKVM